MRGVQFVPIMLPKRTSPEQSDKQNCEALKPKFALASVITDCNSENFLFCKNTPKQLVANYFVLRIDWYVSFVVLLNCYKDILWEPLWLTE